MSILNPTDLLKIHLENLEMQKEISGDMAFCDMINITIAEYKKSIEILESIETRGIISTLRIYSA